MAVTILFPYTSLHVLLAWVLIYCVCCWAAQLQSDNCNTMPINPTTSEPYDLNSYDDHTYVKLVSEFDVGDELNLTYGCEFGYHFEEYSHGTPIINIPTKTVHCLDGLWDLDGDPLTEFPRCITVMTYRHNGKQYVYNLHVYTLPGYIDHRNMSFIYGHYRFQIPIIHKGLFGDLMTRKDGFGYYVPDPDFNYQKQVLEEAFNPGLSRKWSAEFYFPNGSTIPGEFTDWEQLGPELYRTNFTSVDLHLDTVDSGYYYYKDNVLFNVRSSFGLKGLTIKRFEFFYIDVIGPVHGEWGDWVGAGPCDSTCGSGLLERYRFCDNPAPARGGMWCQGDQNGTFPCEGLDPCPVDGNWSPWGPWGECVAVCAEGTRVHSRTCTNPEPAWGGLDCEGESEEEGACYTHPCPIDGNWSEWEDWSACSVSCGGGGIQSRSRTCTNPEPRYGGADCAGDLIEMGNCGDTVCNVDGAWTQWSEWSGCSESCGFGIKTRTRSCTDPAPAGTGRDCPGSMVMLNYYQEEPCMESLECPVDGNWTAWTAWTNCTVLCGGGVSSRIRTCTNPAPAHGGLDCEGNSTQTIEGCNSDPCGIDGAWSEWSEWLAPCTVTCGGGIKIRNRNCDNPPPTYGGADCRGPSVHESTCSTQRCLDGAWSPWSMWSVCSHSCRGGVQARGRSCTNPRPGPGGQDCPADDPYTMWQRCNTQPCPIDGRWNNWSEWSECPVSCGGGYSVKLRNCSNPPPQWGGKECKGQGVKQKPCNRHVCPLIAVPHNVKYTAADTNITVTWEVPLEYEWPVLYYIVHFRERMSRNQSLATLVHAKGEEGYHYNMYDLDSFITRPTKGNSTFQMTIRKLKPFTEYELCMTSKYNHVKNSEPTQVKVVKTKKFAWPAPPDPVTIEYADVTKEGEYKVLIRWKESDWANYSKPAQYHLMIRDVLEPQLPPKGWTYLANVTTEITGYLLRESKNINLQRHMYIVQVVARNSKGISKPAVCKDIIDYQSVGRDKTSRIQVLPLSVSQAPAILNLPLPLLLLAAIFNIYIACDV